MKYQGKLACPLSSDARLPQTALDVYVRVRMRYSRRVDGLNCRRLQAQDRKAQEMALDAFETVNHARMLTAQGEEDSRRAKHRHPRSIHAWRL